MKLLLSALAVALLANVAHTQELGFSEDAETETAGPETDTADEPAAAKSKKLIELSQKGRALAWPAELRWGKFKTPKGRALRGPIMKVTIPSDVVSDIGAITLENGALLSSEKGSARLRIGSLKDQLVLPGDLPPVNVSVRLSKSKIETAPCAKQGLTIERVGAAAKTPYYLLFSCARKAGRISVAFSHPLELESLSTSALEREGKGEGYKVYELTTSSNLGREGELIRFEFRINGETQKFRVLDSQRTGKNEEAKEPVFVYRAGLGLGQYSIEAPRRSQSSLQPSLSAEFRTAPFWGHLAGSGGVFLSPGISLSGDSETYLEFNAGLGYRIGGAARGNEFYAEPSARFFAIHQEFTKLGVSAHHNQAGFGLSLGNKGALDESGYEISLNASGYGLTEEASHFDAGARYAFLMGKIPSGVGLAFAQQTQKSATATYTFSRMMVQLFFWP